MMAMKHDIQLLGCFTTIWIVVMVAIPGTEGNLMEYSLQRCCSVGSTWGTNHSTCTGPPLPVSGIPPEDRSICHTAIYICCIKIHRHLNCDKGKQSAMNGQLCTLLPTPGGETHKDCCDGCSLGLVAGRRRIPCGISPVSSFGSPWDESYKDCCENAASQQGPARLSACELGTHTCNPNTETCIGAADGFRCVPKGAVQNPIRPGQCPQGFIRNRETQTCDDLDECIQNVCPPNHICINSIGSYNCIPRSQASECPPGFKHNPVTSSCIDIDECSEGIHNCDPAQELCLNSHGSYQCQPKSSKAKDCPAGFKWSTTLLSCEDVDECAEKLHTCNEELQECENVIGSYHCILKGPACPHGFQANLGANECSDIDECSERLDDCVQETHYCVNTRGSYQCHSRPATPKCGTGYKSADGSCKDINECEEGVDSCNRELEVCVNAEGSFFCNPISTTNSAFEQPTTPVTDRRALPPTRRTKYRGPVTVRKCSIGYKFSRTVRTCADVNECEESNPCAVGQTCQNAEGSYKCLCQQGYVLDVITKTCNDVNECQLGLHSCSLSQRCDNTIGSYTCFRTTSCGTGYTLNAHRDECEDDDECLLGTHNCGPDFICRNTDGSFRCNRVRCPAGQRLLPDGTCYSVNCDPGMETDFYGNCIDINECTRGNDCRPNQRCVNSVGSYRCQDLINCGGGYEMNEIGSQCVDIDECSLQQHDCSPPQNCRNVPGGYTCECPPGYRLNNERQCEDVDECTRYQGQICAITSTCQNTQGSYSCTCKDGFRKSDDGRNCIDIDECNDVPNICHQTCINVWGSHQCSCEQGFTLGPDGRTCQDIDECSLWGGRGSLCIGICINEPGSYKCSCPEGYRLSPDQRTCQDIDECEEQNTCKGSNEVCLNTRGSFKCNIIICPSNYVRDREHRNRCKRNECPKGDEDCRNQPLSFSYNYLTFVSNIRMPLNGQIDLFTMRGPRFTFTTVNFSLDLKRASAPGGITPATRDNFHLRNTAFNEAMISLVKSIPGPQEIELELLMNMYHNGLFGGKAIAKIFIFVTQNEY